MSQISVKEARCQSARLSAPVEMLRPEGNAGQVSTQFQIKAYTGAVVERWWGKLAVVVDGISASQNLPIFRDHDHGKIVGFATKTWKESGSFFVSGKFSGVTAESGEVRGLADEGFPWQASIGVRPITVLSIEPGGEMEVNGQVLTGPAEVWLASEVFETSFVPLGADSDTSVSTFSKFDEQPAPDNGMVPAGAKSQPKKGDQMKITLALLEQDAPDLLAQIRADAADAGRKEGEKQGAAAELARIKGVADLSMPGHEALVQTLMFDGKTDAAGAALAMMAAEKKLRDAAAEHLVSGGIKPVAAAVPPAVEVSSGDGADDGAFSEEKARAQYAKSNDLQREFDSEAAYLAYAKANSRGSVRVLKK